LKENNEWASIKTRAMMIFWRITSWLVCGDPEPNTQQQQNEAQKGLARETR